VIAEAKLLQKGDTEEIDKIHKKIMPKKEIRKVLFSDCESDLSLIEANFNERDARIAAGEMLPRKGNA
jgi:hypothetical protein